MRGYRGDLFSPELVPGFQSNQSHVGDEELIRSLLGSITCKEDQPAVYEDGLDSDEDDLLDDPEKFTSDEDDDNLD